MANDDVCKSADGFEVVEVPFARSTSTVPTSLEERATETNQAPVPTTSSTQTDTVDFGAAAVDGLRDELRVASRKLENKSITHERRVRTIEYCLDDCESEIQTLNKQVQVVKGKADQSIANLEALADLPRLVDETNVLANDNSARIDRLIVKYVPSVEVKVQALRLEQEKRFSQTEVAIDDVSRKAEAINPEITDVRRIAAEANLRVRALEQVIPQLKADFLMTLATELAGTHKSARADRDHAGDMLERLSKEHMDMWQDARELSLRVKRTEEAAQHLANTVVPLLEHKFQRQQLLMTCRNAEVNETRQAADARDFLLGSRLDRLERTVRCTESSFALENIMLKRRLSALETAVELLLANKAPQAIDATPAAFVPIKFTLDRLIKAEILRREIRAELGKRYTVRQRRQISRLLTQSAIRAAALRVALAGEIRRRKQRRCDRAPFSRFAPSAAALRAACIRRELRVAIASRQTARQVLASLAGPIRAACIGREVRAEVARRQSKRRADAPARVPSVAAIRAACIGRELRKEVARRQRLARTPSPAAIRAACIAREVKMELARRQAKRAAVRTPSLAAIRAACIGREVRKEVARRQNKPSLFAAALRAACIGRELRIEVARRQDKPNPFAAALLAACIGRELRIEVARRQGMFLTPFASALFAACVARESRIEIARRQNARAASPFPAPSAAEVRAASIRREIRAEISRRDSAALRRRASSIKESAINAEILRRALVAEISRRKAGAASPKTQAAGTLAVLCKTVEGDVSLTVQVPGFVSVRYLKQLIYFKGSCAMHPATMDLVYCGQVLDDGWKVGGGVFSAPTLLRSRPEESTFRGIEDGATVFILVKGCYTARTA